MKSFSLHFVTLIFWMVVSQTLHARPFRSSMFPNGTVLNCANCHVNPAGGGQRTPFGQAVFAIVGGPSTTPFWSPALAATDSDGDGRTNGEEVGDADGDGVPTGGVTVTNPGNRPPVFTSVAPASATIGLAYQYQASATDAEGNTMVFSKLSAPAWINVSSAGLVTGSPPENGAGQFNVALKVLDQGTSTKGYSAGFSTQEFALEVIASYAGWQNLKFSLPAEAALAEAGADPDSDGLSNLSEYALRLPPKVPGAWPITSTGFNQEGRLQFVAETRDDDPKLTLRGESAGDLDFLSAVSLDAIVTDPVPGDGFKTHTFLDSESALTATRRFGRITFVIEP